MPLVITPNVNDHKTYRVKSSEGDRAQTKVLIITFLNKKFSAMFLVSKIFHITFCG